MERLGLSSTSLELETSDTASFLLSLLSNIEVSFRRFSIISLGVLLVVAPFHLLRLGLPSAD
jgi:uncharacterized membrane protein YqjE